MKKALLIAVAMIAIPQFALATMTFEQLDDNTFTVSHRVKWFGGRGQAMDLVYEKAASLCVAAGYSHLKVMEQESNVPAEYQSANATVTVKFFLEGGDDRIACNGKATEEYVKQAKTKLEKKGYKGPVAVEPAAEDEDAASICTVEQIAAMVKAGLTEEQIKAACSTKN